MAKVYINLTQHAATDEQRSAGVRDLTPALRKELSTLLTVDEVPDLKDLRERALKIARLVAATVQELKDNGKSIEFMIGGAPFLMPVLARVLSETYHGTCVYAFSKRVAVEDPTTGVKTSVFAHEGFVHHYD